MSEIPSNINVNLQFGDLIVIFILILFVVIMIYCYRNIQQFPIVLCVLLFSYIIGYFALHQNLYLTSEFIVYFIYFFIVFQSFMFILIMIEIFSK